MYLSLNFPFVSPPIILEVLKMFPLWQKANRLPFWQHLRLLYDIECYFPMNFWDISIQNSAYWNWLFSRIWILCIFTKCRITGIFRLFTAKRFHRNCWIWSATYEKWHHENCWRKYTLVITFTYKKSAAVQQRFASVYGSKKATYTLGNGRLLF